MPPLVWPIFRDHARSSFEPALAPRVPVIIAVGRGLNIQLPHISVRQKGHLLLYETALGPGRPLCRFVMVQVLQLDEDDWVQPERSRPTKPRPPIPGS